MSSRRSRSSRRSAKKHVSSDEEEDEDSDVTVTINGNGPKSKEDSDSDIQILDLTEDLDAPSTEETSRAGSEASTSRKYKDPVEMLICTSCGRDIHPKFPIRCNAHPDLKVLICKACLEYYESGEITQDDDGLDEQCRWCGEGGELLGCDHCNNTFCKSCIKRNLGKAELKSVESGDEWKCYICDNTQIRDLVNKCAELIKRKEAKQNGGTPKFDEMYKCTACGKQINPNKTGSVARHPDLKVLVCKKCFKYYKSGEITQDAKGFDEQCRWCSEGGNLFGCDMCHNAFCKACVVRNLGRDQIFAIKNPKGGKWKCYICKPAAIEELKLQCTNLIRRLKGKKPKAEKTETDKCKEESEAEAEPEQIVELKPVKRVGKSQSATKKKQEKTEKKPKESVGEEKIEDSSSIKKHSKCSKSPKTEKNSISSLPHNSTVLDPDDLSTILALQESTWNVDVENIATVVENLQDLTFSLSKTLKKVGKQLETYSETGDEESKGVVGPEKSLQTLKKVWFRYQQWTAKVVAGIDINEEDSDDKGDDKKAAKADIKAKKTSERKEKPDDAEEEREEEKTSDVDEIKGDEKDNEVIVSKNKKKAAEEETEIDDSKDIEDQNTGKNVQKLTDSDTKVNDDCNDDAKSTTVDKENDEAKFELLKEMAEELSMDVESGTEGVTDMEVSSPSNSGKEENAKEKDKAGKKVKDKKSKKAEKKESTVEVEPKDRHSDSENEADRKEKVISSNNEDHSSENEADAEENEVNSNDGDNSNAKDSDDGAEDKKLVESDIGSLPSSDNDSSGSSDSSFEMESEQRKKRKHKRKEKGEKKKDKNEQKLKKDKKKGKKSKISSEEQDTDDEDLLSRSTKAKKIKQAEKKTTRSSSRNSKSKNKLDSTKKEKNKVNSDSSNYDSDLDAEIDKLAKMPSLRKSKRHKEDEEPQTEEGSEKEDGKKSGKKHSKKGRKKTDTCSTDDEEEEGKESEVEEENDSEKEDDSSNSKKSEVSMKDDNEEAKNALLDELDEMDSDKSASDKNGNSDSDSDVISPKKKKKTEKKKKSGSSESGSDSDVDIKTPKSKKWHSKLLNAKISDSDSDSDVLHTPKKRKGKRKRSSASDKSESDAKSSASDSESGSDPDSGKEKKKNKSKSKKETESKDGKGRKRRRIKRLTSSSSDNGSDKGSGDEEVTTPGGHGKRKKIRKILANKKLRDETKAAVQAEEERRKRIAERQKQFNNLVQVTDDSSPTKCPITTQLILERDEKGEALIEVHKTLIKKLKPHQVEAVQFMWDCCCENLERMKEENGGGCILAHCMGLGKTLSVISFVFTMMQHSELTNISKILVICPLNTVLNWQNEFLNWLDDIEMDDDFLVHELSSIKTNWPRAHALKEWQKDGGIMIIGYEMFRNLTQGRHCKGKKLKQIFQETLVDPGPDIVVCDEGHILKNDASAISKATNKIRTKRRVVLTGTPLQNSLEEYHCMVDFVKPNLLGTRKEFSNRFVHPITNGQCSDSTAYDVKIMKRRAHILHEKLSGCVQRRDYSALTKYLPAKFEYVLAVRLARKQIQLYRAYLDQYGARGRSMGAGATLFSDYNILMRIWTHPWVLHLGEVRAALRAKDDYESEGSFIDDGNTSASEMSGMSDSTSSDEGLSLSDDSDEPKKKKKKKDKKGKNDEKDEDEVIKKWRSKRNTGNEAGPSNDDVIAIEDEEKLTPKEWWGEYVTEEDENKIEISGKLSLLFEILRMCEDIGDKVLIFSQSLLSLDIIEDFLERIDAKYQEEKAEREQKKEEKKKEKKDGSDTEEPLNLLEETDFGKSWTKGIDYFRMDGSTGAQSRKRWQEIFNDETNFRARLFLISTRAGSLGINLVGANRVIIFDASWNPSHDVQSIFRVYRFGQTKPCYVYRFLAQGTMEEKIYERQVTKQSLSQRVVDEHQIERHFDSADLQELYSFTPDDLDDPNRKEKPTPVLPKDNLLAELLKTKKEWIVGYHEHDSLLENKIDETLTEEERKAAWKEYEDEKKGISLNVQQGKFNPNFMQQNMMNQMAGSPYAGMMANLGIHPGMPLFNYMTPNDMVAIVREVNSKYPDLPPNMLQQKCQMVLRQVLQYRIMQRQEQEQKEQMARLKFQAEQRRQLEAQAAAGNPNAQQSLLRQNLLMGTPMGMNPTQRSQPTTIDITGGPSSTSASATLKAVAERKKKS